MTARGILRHAALATLLAGTASAAPPAEPTASVDKPSAGGQLLYTTYFYTAAEAIVHGYEADTHARIISLDQRGTIWQGTVKAGETTLVPTGAGVFSFVSDKKASILVGTPSACTVVGYWVRDENGSFLSKRFYAVLPASSMNAEDRLIVWARKDTTYTITDLTADKLVGQGKLAAGKQVTFLREVVQPLSGHVLEIRSGGEASLQVQVYYDEGFFVPGEDGRAAGKRFLTYVGGITNRNNDLTIYSPSGDAQATVTDLTTDQVLWQGTVPKGVNGFSKRFQGTSHYLSITADREVSVAVAPIDFPNYMEHHYAAGLEGTGIETDFLLSTPGSLWLFSYFGDNHVKVLRPDGSVVWTGKLGAGETATLQPGAGKFQVVSTAGLSVMGGSGSCDAKYSPAGGLFRIDEELFKVRQIIVEQRLEQARREGKALDAPAAAAAPLSEGEMKQAQDYVRAKAGKTMNPQEVRERMDAMKTQP